MFKKKFAAALAALMLASSMSVTAFAEPAASETDSAAAYTETESESNSDNEAEPDTDITEEPDLIDISSAEVTLGGVEFEYTGAEITPSVTVTINGVTLTENVDFTVAYSNNIDIGTAAAEITGIGGYVGTAYAYFNIVSPVQSAPSNLRSTSNTTNGYTLNWTGAAKASGYEIFKYNSSTNLWEKYVSTKNLSYKIAGVSSGTKNKYAVRAYRTVGGKTFFSKMITHETATLPQTANNMIIKDVTTNGYTLKWSRVSGADCYVVERYNSVSKTWSVIKKATGTSLVISDRSPAQKNTYRVCAVVKAGGKEYKGEYLKKRFTTKPAQVTGFTYTRPAKGYMTFRWNKVSGAKKYQLYYSTEKSGNYKLFREVSGTKTSLMTSYVPTGKKLYFKIRAVSQIDESTQSGKCSSVIKGISFNKLSVNSVMNKCPSSYSVTQVNAQGYTLSDYNRNRLYSALTCLGGSAGYILYDIDSGCTVAYNANSYFGTASTVKMPYILYCLREMEDGSPTMDTMLTYLPSDYNGGSSWIKYQPFYTQYSIRTVMQLIGDYSDNCGYYMLQDKFGYDGYNRFISSLGCKTSVNSYVRWGYVSACDSTREWVNMWDYLRNGRYASFARDVFSTSCAANIRDQLGNRYTVYEKSGWTDGANELYNETALVRAEHPYVVICLSNRTSSQRMRNVAEISESIHNEMWRYFDN
ncbi:MAG: serine hydrolase [Oscillospiraceae bacterium]